MQEYISNKYKVDSITKSLVIEYRKKVKQYLQGELNE